jgi:hypothetical protein
MSEPILYHGFDNALLGYAMRCGSEPVAVYDMEIMMQIMVQRDEMTQQDALDHLEYNYLGGWLGDSTPWIVVTKEVAAWHCK